MTQITKQENSAAIVAAQFLLSDAATLILQLKDRMTLEEKQQFILLFNAVRKWSREFATSEKHRP